MARLTAAASRAALALRAAANSSRITSSSGGSSIARSTTGSAPSASRTTALAASLARPDSTACAASCDDHRAQRARASARSTGCDSRTTTRLSGRTALHQRAQIAVVDQPALVDHDHARAERGHVVHVVAGEQHRRAVALVVAADELAHRACIDDVEPDGRLVEEQHLRPVEQRRRQLALHALAERQLARRLVDERRRCSSSSASSASVSSDCARGHVVDRAVQREGLGGRQVPEQLLLLAHHQRDAACRNAALALLRHEAGDRAPRRSVGWSRPGQHLQRGGLAGAVGAEEADALARGDVERQLVDRLDVSYSAEQRAQRGGEAGRACGPGSSWRGCGRRSGVGRHEVKVGSGWAALAWRGRAREGTIVHK